MYECDNFDYNGNVKIYSKFYLRDIDGISEIRYGFNYMVYAKCSETNEWFKTSLIYKEEEPTWQELKSFEEVPRFASIEELNESIWYNSTSFEDEEDYSFHNSEMDSYYVNDDIYKGF